MRRLFFLSALGVLVGLGGAVLAQETTSDHMAIAKLLATGYEVVGEFGQDPTGNANTLSGACQQCNNQIADLPELKMVCVSESAGARKAGRERIVILMTSKRMVETSLQGGGHLCSDIVTVAGTEPPRPKKERVGTREAPRSEPVSEPLNEPRY